MKKLIICYLFVIQCFALSAQQPFFRFAVISDTHISAEQTQNLQNLDSVVADINAQQGIAFVFVLGDISDKGDLESLQKAKKALSKLNIPFYALAGNHDTKNSQNYGSNFKKVFGDNKFRHSFNGLFFLGINTGELLNQNEGHVAAQDVAWLRRTLKNIGAKRPVFLLTHHPLKSGDVDNWYEITDILREYNAQPIISGHYHKNFLYEYDGFSGVVNCGMNDGNGNSAHYTIYDMADSLYIFDKKIGALPEKWHALVLEPKFHLPKDTKKYPHPDFNINKEYKNVKEVWVKRLESDIYAEPTVANGNIYFGTMTGEFFCFDAQKGKQKWTFRALDMITGKAAVVGDKVIFGSADKNVYCLDANTGKLVWKYANDNPITTRDSIAKFLNEKNGIIINLYDSSLITKDELVGEVFVKPDFFKQISVKGKYNVTQISENEYIFTTTSGYFGKILITE
jgi:predicted phosphodiesterase